MKKLLTILTFLLTITSVSAEVIFVEANITQDNYWHKNGIETKKVLSVARKLIHENGLKWASIKVERNWRIPNAYTYNYTKSILINTGILPYIENDDELAFILGHELSHAQEAYDGALKIISMKMNNKKYEYKADLKAIDYMVKAGYNPIAGIIVGNKLFDEPLWDWGCLYTHPKGSSRLVKMYEYIYKKYPSYLKTNMANNNTFIDFIKSNEKEINAFYQKEIQKSRKNNL